MSALFANGRAIWLLVVITTALLVVAEIGFRIGRRTSDATGVKKTHASMLIGAIVGLLGLLLAFSFAIVDERLDKRRALVIEDANAIGTTYLRAGLLPAPYDERVRTMLREYVDLRVNIKSSGIDGVVARASELQTSLWEQATAVARANPTSLNVSLFVRSLNNMIDVNETRLVVAVVQRMPGAILATLCAVAALSIGIVGFRAGLDRSRSPVSTAVVVIVIAAVMTIIIDLDRPAGRLFDVSQRAMKDTRDMMSPVHRVPSADRSALGDNSDEEH